MPVTPRDIGEMAVEIGAEIVNRVTGGLWGTFYEISQMSSDNDRGREQAGEAEKPSAGEAGGRTGDSAGAEGSRDSGSNIASSDDGVGWAPTDGDAQQATGDTSNDSSSAVCSDNSSAAASTDNSSNLSQNDQAAALSQ